MKLNAKIFKVLIILLTTLFFVFFIIKIHFGNFSKEKEIVNGNQLFIAGGIVPHHLLAKEIIQNFFEETFSNEKPETIILLSPDHFNSKALCKEGSFITLKSDTETFEKIKVDNFLLKNLQEKFDFCFNNSFIAQDHGITNLLLYIEKYSPQTKILPILIPSSTSKEKIASLVKTINSQSSQGTIVIASVDFSHYLPKDVAEFHDRKSIRVVLNFEEENFQNLDVDCWQCLYGARLFAKLKNKEKAKIVDYKNSAEFLNDEKVSETTSYFSVIFENGSSEAKENVRTLMFVGDIMLDRGVEYLMKEKSIFYPFEKVEQFLRGIDFVIGNLEGTIVKNPPDFGPKSLKFAFSPDVISAFSFSHFNLFSLANNHTFDLKKEGFEETKETLKKAKIDFVGHPLTCKEDSFLEKEDIIFLAFNKTFSSNCSDEEIIEIVKETKNKNPEKFLILLFHWGQEYQPKSSISQRKLAHSLIDAGADLIIGNHPHVVQEVEKYNGKLIFYSLGNFIFDQFFSKETQESLGVGVEFYPEKVVYHLFPLKSEMAQPSLMNLKERAVFLENLAKKSDQSLVKEILQGKLEVERKKLEKKEKPSSTSAESFIGSKINFNVKRLPGQLVSHLFDVEGLPSPKAVKFSPDGSEIWVTHLLNKRKGVTVLNATSGQIIAEINLENGGGVEIVFSPDGKKAFVSQMETAKVFEIDTQTKKILRSFFTQSSWTKVLAVSKNGRFLYASNWSGNNVTEIDLLEGKVKRQIPTVKTPRGLYLTEDGKFLYVAGFDKGEIEKINLETGEKKIIFKSGGAARHIVGDEENGILFVSDMGENVIWKVNMKEDSVEKFVETDNNPNTIALSYDKKILFVSCRGKNYSAENYYLPGPEWGSVLLFDAKTGKMLDAIVGGNQPTGLDISADGKFLAFSDFLDGKVEIFSLPSYEELEKGNGGASKIYKNMLKK